VGFSRAARTLLLKLTYKKNRALRAPTPKTIAASLPSLMQRKSAKTRSSGKKFYSFSKFNKATAGGTVKSNVSYVTVR
jgi:hypothetical protein